MDQEVVNKVTATSTEFGASRSIAATPFGDVVSLSTRIRFGNIRPKADENLLGKIDTLEVTDAAGQPVDLSAFTEILANSDASVLLLVSAQKVAVVEIPPEFYKQGYLNTQTEGSSPVFKVIYDAAAEKKIPVVKAAFHPYNQFSVVILLQTDYLIVLDLRSYEDKRYRLPAHNQFLSFCCGPDIDWLRFSVFLSTSKGEVYVICPIIPLGTIISLTVLEELWAWADNQREFWIGSKSDRNDRPRSDYVNLLEAYLCDLFGDIDARLKDVEDKDNEFVIAGEGITMKRQSGFCIANYNTVVQGPLVVRQGKARDADGVQARDTSAIVDLCVPFVSPRVFSGHAAKGPEAAPVIVAVRSTGFVEVLLVDSEEESVGYIGPLFESLNAREKLFTLPAPVLLQADTFSACAVPQASGATWRLYADPVFMHYFYLLCKAEGKAFILSSAWLKTMLANVHDAVEEAEHHAQEQENTWQGEEMFNKGKDSPTGKRGSVAASNGKPLELSMCIPMFEAPAATPAVSVQSFVVYFDAYLGHVALLLLGDGNLIAVNVSVHTKLCELHTHLQALSQRAQSDRERSLALLPETLRKEMTDYFLPYRMTQTLTKKIEEGLRQFPVLEVTVESDEAARKGVDPSPSEAQRLLARAKADVESKVVVPLKQLHDHTMFYCDIVRDRVQLQRDLLEGHPTSGFPGIAKLLADIQSKQQALQQRIQAIHEQDEYLRSVLLSQTEFTTNLPQPLSRAERVYHRQMNQWMEVVRDMNVKVALLKLKTDSRTSATTAAAAAAANARSVSTGSSVSAVPAGAAVTPNVHALTPPRSTTAPMSTLRNNSLFFKASTTSFAAATATPSTAGGARGHAMPSSTSSTLWTSARSPVRSSTPPPTATPQESSFASPVPSQPSAPPSVASYYHPEAVRFPNSTPFSPPAQRSAGSSGGSLHDVDITKLTAQLEKIGDEITNAKKVVEGTLRDLKLQPKQQHQQQHQQQQQQHQQATSSSAAALR